MIEEIVIIHTEIEDVWKTLRKLEWLKGCHWIEGQEPADYDGWEEAFEDKDFVALGICIDVHSKALTYLTEEFENKLNNDKVRIIYIG